MTFLELIFNLLRNNRAKFEDYKKFRVVVEWVAHMLTRAFKSELRASIHEHRTGSIIIDECFTGRS